MIRHSTTGRRILRTLIAVFSSPIIVFSQSTGDATHPVSGLATPMQPLNAVSIGFDKLLDTYHWNGQLRYLQADGPFNASGKCPAMTTPPALQSALVAYNKSYKLDYDKAMSKYSDTAWYDPTEAERKAVVAKQRAGHDLAYAPTGSALAAGKIMKVTELETLMARQSNLPTTSPTVMAGMPSGIHTAKANIAQLPLTTSTIATATPVPAPTAVAVTLPATVPVPAENPLAYTQVPVESAQNQPSDKKAPFWKFWSKSE